MMIDYWDGDPSIAQADVTTQHALVAQADATVALLNEPINLTPLNAKNPIIQELARTFKAFRFGPEHHGFFKYFMAQLKERVYTTDQYESSYVCLAGAVCECACTGFFLGMNRTRLVLTSKCTL
jgi:hypothetical protein